MEGYTRVYKAADEYTGENEPIEGIARLYKAIEGYTRVYEAIDGGTRIY